MKIWNRLFVLAVLLGAAMSARAGTVIVNQVLDASLIFSDHAIEPPGPAFDLAVGDTLQLNFSFLPGQALELSNPNYIMGSFNTASSDGSGQTIGADFSMSFVGLAGTAHDPVPGSGSTSGNGVNAAFYSQNFMDGGLPAVISFTGLQFNITITSYSGGVNSQSFLGSYLNVGAASVAAVPEPGSGIMACLGLMIVGLRLRQRIIRRDLSPSR